MLSHENEEVDAPGHEILTYFSNTQEQLIDETFSEADDALDSWISEMFDVVDSFAIDSLL